MNEERDGGGAASPPGARRSAPMVAAGAVVLVLGALFAFREVDNFDVPWHLAVGREILATGTLPRHDTLTRMAMGRPWLDVYWLAEVVMALAERARGIVLLQLGAVAVVTAGVAAAMAAGACGFGLELPLALAAVIAASQRMAPHPSLTSLVLPPVFLLLLEQVRCRARWRTPVMALAALEIVWVNSHGSYFLGPVLAGLAFLASLADAAAATRRRAHAVTFACVSLATLANPHGWHVWRLLLPYVGGIATLQEWTPTFAPEARYSLDEVWLPYVALLGVTVLGLLAAGRKLEVGRAASVLFFAALSVLAVRNVAPFALVAVAVVPPMLAVPLARLTAPARARLRNAIALATVLLAIVLIVRVATNRFYTERLKPAAIGPGWHPTAFPHQAYDWVEAAGIVGQAFHNHEIGGYYDWRFHGRRTALLDGRIDLVAPDAFVRYREAMLHPDLFEALAAEVEATHVILKYATWDGGVLVAYLERSPLWRRVFADAGAVVYLRAGSREPAPGVISPRAEHPWDRRARLWLEPLRRLQDRLPLTALNLAMLAEAGGHSREAAAQYERAIAARPGMLPARIHLALLALDLGDRSRAEESLLWLEANAPGDPAIARLRAEMAERLPAR